MKKCIMLVFILAIGIFCFGGCGRKTTNSDGLDTDEVGGDICPCVMVEGIVYFDTGYKSPIDNHSGNMDGQIISECSASEVPTEDNQSNFGKGYGYQYGSDEGTIEIQLSDGNWYVFATEEVKANYEP